MFLFGGGKSPRRPGERVAPATPARILTSYARTSEELQLFLEDLAACSPAKHLDWEEALEAFPDGVIPSAWFELGGRRWQLTARAGADGRRVLHLATPLAASPEAAGRELALQTQQQQQPSQQQQQVSQQRRRGSGRLSKQPLLLGSAADELRKAGRNEALLQDDWRLGRVRLAWPPAPAPVGYAPLAAEVCDVTGALQELYGR